MSKDTVGILQKRLWRTIGHFITPRLRLYLARLLFSVPNKHITKCDQTKGMDNKMMVIVCDLFADPVFLEYLRSQAVLMRVELMNEFHYDVITLPEESKIVYEAIAHFVAANGIPVMLASPFEQSSLWLGEGEVGLKGG